jgi:hypothetical protein
MVGKPEHTRLFGGRGREAGLSGELECPRGGLIAARTISTVANYAPTGVSCQENVRVLFSAARDDPRLR